MLTSNCLKQLLLPVVITSLLTTAMVAEPAQAAGQKYALLIGINDYAAPLTDLQFCRNDIQELRDILISIGFPPTHVVCMYDGVANTDYVPSRQNIVRQLELRLSLASQEEDLVLIAFSGHGFLEGQMSYLCPCDANAEDLAATCVSMEQIYERMRACRAGQKVMMIDACRNMAQFRNVRTKDSSAGIKGFIPETPPRGIRLLSSCEAGQISVEDANLRHGVFMHYVAQGLRGYADQECEGNKNGRVSLDELYFYAHQRTKMHVANNHSLLQLPWMKGEVTGPCELGAAPTDLPPLVDTATAGTAAAGTASAEPTTEPVAEPRTSPSTATADNGMADRDRLDASVPPAYAALSNQADNYVQAGDYVNAIAAYSAIIEDSSIPIDLRKTARRRRGAAYLARNQDGDLEKAIIDHQAAGLKGINISLQASSAQLKRGNEVLGTVKQGQVLEVTEFKGDWLWVNSVNSSESIRGWIHKNSLEKKTTPAASSLVSNQPRPSSSGNYENYNYGNNGMGNTRSLNNGYQNSSGNQATDDFTRNYIQRNGRPPSIWETPRWESFQEIREKRARGLLR